MNVDGFNLELVRVDRGRPTLVFLHAGLGAAASWGSLPVELSDAIGCSTLIYSRAGYGASDPRPGPLKADFLEVEARRLDEILTRVAAPPYVLVGHSDGASIAAIHVTRPDPDVIGAVLIAPHVFVEPMCVEQIQRDHAGQDDIEQRLRRLHGDKAPHLFKSWTQVWTSEEFGRWTLVPALPSIRCPVLVIQGEQDPYGTQAQVDALVTGCGAASLVLADCAHAPHRDHPDVVRRAIVDFVTQVW